MNTVTLDDENLAVNALIRQLNKIDPGGNHKGFVRMEDMLTYLGETPADIAFIDIDLGYSVNGLELTRHLTEQYPEMNIFIYTGHAELDYKAQALDLFVCGYLVKPVAEDDLRCALTKLRRPINELRVQCFGHFEVFYGTSVVKFDRKDSKEILAYLIDKRGAEVSEDELRCIVFPEENDGDEKRTYVRNIIYDIRKTLGKYGVPKTIISNTRGGYSIDTSLLRCDYFDYLEGKPVVTARLRQYMEQYSWAETVKSNLFN